MIQKKNKTKKIIKISIGIIIFIIIVTGIYYFQFTSDGYRITVPYRSTFTEISDNIYINKNNSNNKEEIIELVNQAKERNTNFWGTLYSLDDTVIIICDDDKLLSKLGGEKDTKTIIFPKTKNFISISNEYCNIDILSHELTHSEFHYRLNSKALKSIPLWFDEGLATQNDYREQYSQEEWMKQTNNGTNIIAIEDMDEPSEFYAGTTEDRRFRYLIAKHEVSEWIQKYQTQGLLKLIDDLNSGKSFNSAYIQ